VHTRTLNDSWVVQMPTCSPEPGGVQSKGEDGEEGGVGEDLSSLISLGRGPWVPAGSYTPQSQHPHPQT
jgi:hypothetical protein